MQRRRLMQKQFARLFAMAIVTGLVGCSMMHKKNKEMDVSADQMSPPARATMNKEVGNGKVEKITKEVERGKSVYDVEANVGGKHMEYLIADSDGELLGTEVPIAWNDLPEPVKAAAEKHFGTTSGLTAMKGVEYGETHYEIEGMKDGKKSEISYDANGKKE
jgi:uncharacterized membrane protein YkoI